MGGSGGCGSGVQKKWAVMSRNLTWGLIPYTMCQSLYKEGGQASTLSICRGSTGWPSHSGPIAEKLRTCVCVPVCCGLSACRPAVCINLLIVPIWSSDQCNPPEVHFSLFCKHTHTSRSVATESCITTQSITSLFQLLFSCSLLFHITKCKITLTAIRTSGTFQARWHSRTHSFIVSEWIRELNDWFILSWANIWFTYVQLYQWELQVCSSGCYCFTFEHFIQACSFIQSDNKYLETWISFCALL